MIVLDTVNKSLQLLLSGTGTIPWTTSYASITATTFALGSADGYTSGTTPQTIVAAPIGSTQIQIKYISIQNSSGGAVTATIRLNNNGSLKLLVVNTLQTNEQLQYIDTVGFGVIDSNGNVKSGVIGPTGPVGSGPTGNTGPAGPTTVHTGTATLDFGTANPPIRECTAVVGTQTGILASSAITIWISGDDVTASNGASNHIIGSKLITFTAESIVIGTSFTIRAISEGEVSGTFNVHWSWT